MLNASYRKITRACHAVKRTGKASKPCPRPLLFPLGCYRWPWHCSQSGYRLSAKEQSHLLSALPRKCLITPLSTHGCTTWNVFTRNTGKLFILPFLNLLGWEVFFSFYILNILTNILTKETRRCSFHYKLEKLDIFKAT